MNWKRHLYYTLRVRCGFTHHQARRIILDRYGTAEQFRNLFHREAKKEAKEFAPLIESIVISAASAPTPEEASNRILKQGWPTYPKSEPILPYSIISQSTRQVAQLKEWRSPSTEASKLWYGPNKILKHEIKQGKREFEERNIGTYLQIRKATKSHNSP